MHETFDVVNLHNSRLKAVQIAEASLKAAIATESNAKSLEAAGLVATYDPELLTLTVKGLGVVLNLQIRCGAGEKTGLIGTWVRPGASESKGTLPSLHLAGGYISGAMLPMNPALSMDGNGSVTAFILMIDWVLKGAGQVVTSTPLRI